MVHMAKKSARHQRRSVCPVACGLDIFGDRWTLLIIRDLFCGKRRFKEIAASPESIATNILSNRLARLTQHGLVKEIPAPDGSAFQAYELTDKGWALKPVLESLRDWGLQWEKGTEARLSAAPSQ